MTELRLAGSASKRRRATGLEILPREDLAYLQEGYATLLQTGSSVEENLGGVLELVLGHPGSLARAQLAFSILESLGADRASSRELAIALEYFHTASLVFDDLPSMDDAQERRQHACAHRVHGEAAAILGALALITRAYHLLWQVLGDLPGERRQRAADLVAQCLGANGILDGQAKDLHFDADHASERSVEAVAAGKTVTLVRLSLLLPALVGGASDDDLEQLELLARAWGFAYQILDDLKDVLLSRTETGKSTARDRLLGRPNLALVLGCDLALGRLSEHLRVASQQVAVLPELGFGRLQAFLEAEKERMRIHLGARCA